MTSAPLSPRMLLLSRRRLSARHITDTLGGVDHDGLVGRCRCTCCSCCGSAPGCSVSATRPSDASTLFRRFSSGCILNGSSGGSSGCTARRFLFLPPFLTASSAWAAASAASCCSSCFSLPTRRLALTLYEAHMSESPLPTPQLTKS